MGQLDGRVAIVTGSGRGIGQQIALRLARDGASVVVNDLDAGPAEETVSLIKAAGGKAVACNGDVSAKDFGPRVIKTAVDTFGDCHILVNNAGYTWDAVIQKMTDDQWEAIIGLHLSAPFRIQRAFFEHLKVATDAERKNGQRIVRKVVNISSTSGVNGNAGQANYSSAKAGIIGLTKAIAKEWGRYAVTVNAVAFGYIQTRLTKPLNEGEDGTIEVDGRQVKVGIQGGRLASLNQLIPLGRGGTPEEAANAVFLFCSPDSDYVSGQCLVVNGGL
jgi:3-oxoacyl-[acyl-carrier protein] reductase